MTIQPNCICPGDSLVQSLNKINDNLVLLFQSLSASFTGTRIGGTCLCSETKILQTINNNIAEAIDAIAGQSAVQAGIESVGSGDTSLAITFPTAFNSAPAVIPKLISPTGATEIVPRIDYSTLTATGVTFRFSAIPAANWHLTWLAAEES